jgi:hypothetical protein
VIVLLDEEFNKGRTDPVHWPFQLFLFFRHCILVKVVLN